jgi:hypothetical protein
MMSQFFAKALSLRWIVVFLIFMVGNAHAQDKLDISKLGPKKFIDKVEFVIGSNLTIPNDHGYGEYIKNAPSQYPMTDVFSSKIGYSFGVGLGHSLSKNFDIVGRVIWERRAYFEEQTDNVPGSFRNFKTNTRNDYTTFSLIPRFFFGKKKQAHLIIGGSYSQLSKSFGDENLYINGQLYQHTTRTNPASIKKYSVDALAGMGYLFHLSKSNSLIFLLTYSYGMTDIINVNQLRLTSQSINLSLILTHYRKPYTSQLKQ